MYETKIFDQKKESVIAVTCKCQLGMTCRTIDDYCKFLNEQLKNYADDKGKSWSNPEDKMYLHKGIVKNYGSVVFEVITSVTSLGHELHVLSMPFLFVRCTTRCATVQVGRHGARIQG